MKHIPPRHAAVIQECIAGGHPGWTDALNILTARLESGMIFALLGGRGTGKTQLGVCLLWYASRRSMSYAYRTAFEMFASIKETYRDDSSMSELKAIRALLEPGILVIDELNEANHTTWEGHMLTYLVDKRYQQMKDTLIISNYTADVFAEVVGQSIISRMEECGGHISCKWPSFRKTHTQKESA